MEPFLVATALALLGYVIGSVKIVAEKNEILVERLGRYHRTLSAGMNFIIPLLDNPVYQDTLKEQILDTKPQDAITRDNVRLSVDAIVYWKVTNIYKAYYAVVDVDEALENLVLTIMRSAIGGLDVKETYASREGINTVLKQELDKETGDWGVEVLRVEVQEITPPEELRESMSQQVAAEMRKRATILEAEGKKQAVVEEAEGTVKAMEMISKALGPNATPQDVLRYLVAQRYVDANYRLGESTNSKIIFMDPKDLSEEVADLLGQVERQQPPQNSNNGS